jgi:sulfate adenylyltransferase subunit 1
MVTGASTADAVIILVDVSKVKLGDDGSVELLTQTKRHSTIAHLLQIQHVIVAVNKMDLVDYDQTVYDRIVGAYQQFAQQLGLKDVHAIPLSALAGDNVVDRQRALAWYQGPTLIDAARIAVGVRRCAREAFRFPVQLVARHNGHEANDFRGYMGRIEAGKVAKGDKLVVLPSGQSATVKDIQTLDGSLESATAGQSVTLLLDEYLDISRGDLLAAEAQPSTILKTVNADVCWLSEEPLDLRRKYWLKHTTKQVAARVAKVDRCWTSTPRNAARRHAEAQRHRPHQRERAAAHRGRCLPGHPRHRRLHPDRRSEPPDGGRWYDSDRLISFDPQSSLRPGHGHPTGSNPSSSDSPAPARKPGHGVADRLRPRRG